MTSESPTPDEAGGENEPREHPQDPSEGPDEREPNDVRQHPQDPAEGPDDGSVTEQGSDQD